MKLLGILLSLILTFSSIAPTFVNAQGVESNQTRVIVESFEIENLTNEMQDVVLYGDVSEKLYQKIGGKKVNSITEIAEETNSITTKITTLEDYYDLEGNYQKTVLKIEEFFNDFKIGKAKTKTKEKEFKEPQTIYNFTKSSKINKYNNKNLTSFEENEIKNKVQKIIERTKDFKEKERTEKGLTHEEISNIKKVSKDMQEKQVIAMEDGHLAVDQKALQSVVEENESVFTASGTVEYAGAWDNYYNHDMTNLNFIAQALSSNSHQYVKLTGTTYNNSLNANTLAQFKTNIDTYEDYIIRDMQGATFNEVASWFGVLMGLGSIVAGFGTGPAGWINIVLKYGGALATFQSLTSSSYATLSRLTLSRYAAVYCQNARNLQNYKNWSGVSGTLVNGF